MFNKTFSLFFPSSSGAKTTESLASQAGKFDSRRPVFTGKDTPAEDGWKTYKEACALKQDPLSAYKKYLQSLDYFRLACTLHPSTRLTKEGMVRVWLSLKDLRPFSSLLASIASNSNFHLFHQEESPRSFRKRLRTIIVDSFLESEWQQQCNGRFGGPKSRFKSWKQFYCENELLYYQCGTMEEKMTWLVKNGHDQLLTRLLDQTKSTDIFDEFGNTLVHIAVGKNFKKIVHILLQNGFSPTQVNVAGWSPLHVAALVSNPDVLSLLIETGTDVNGKDKEACSPLHYTALKKHLEKTKCLIEKGALLNVQNSMGISPLHLAVFKESTLISSFLLEKGSDPNCQDIFGQTPLIWAVCKGNKECVTLLLDNGADASIPDKLNRYPLHWAAQMGQKEIITRLTEKNPHVISSKDKWGNTPLAISLFFGHTSLFFYLRKYTPKN